jgi:hypothetical protein
MRRRVSPPSPSASRREAAKTGHFRPSRLWIDMPDAIKLTRSQTFVRRPYRPSLVPFAVAKSRSRLC